MTNPMVERRLAAALAAYREQRDRFLELQDKVGTTSGQAKSRDRMLSVTVDARGQLTALTFTTDGYRTMEPEELSALILETVAQARTQATEQMRRLVTPLLPAGATFDQTASGRLDWRRLLTGEPATAVDMQRALGLLDEDEPTGG